MNTGKKTKFIRRPCGGLNKRQLDVIDGLFNGDEEQAVLDKYKVSRKLYNKWLADSNFTAEFDRRIDAAYRQSDILIARYAPLAAAKLVQLTESDKEETARKACLDILSLATRSSGTRAPTSDPCPPTPASPLSPESASRLLSILAEESKENQL